MRNAETTLAIIEDRGKQRMAALKRKTLVVCESCHNAIHAGKPTRERRKIDEIGSLESRILGNGAPRNAVLNP